MYEFLKTSADYLLFPLFRFFPENLKPVAVGQGCQ